MGCVVLVVCRWYSTRACTFADQVRPKNEAETLTVSGATLATILFDRAVSTLVIGTDNKNDFAGIVYNERV